MKLRSRQASATAAMLAVFAGLTVLTAFTLLAGCGAGSPSQRPSATAASTSQQASPPMPIGPGASFPATPAGRQLAWVIGHMNSGSVPNNAALAQHFSAAFLAQVPAGQLVTALKQVAAAGPLRYGSQLGPATATALVARLDGAQGATLKTTISVESSAAHLISGLLFQPYSATPKPTSWPTVDTALQSLAGQATMVAMEVGSSSPLHGLQPDRVGAIGSAFKLYVLGALGRAIARGTASWNEQLAIRTGWKSLPSGDLRKARAGVRYPLHYFAQQMIAVSDNTAADHLLRRLGRSAVEAALVPLGLREPQRDTPFLSTREMFALKLSAAPSLRAAYIAGGPTQRLRLLARVDALPVSLAQASRWTTPREISSIEWFASPGDLARAMVALQTLSRRPGLTPLRAILARNPGIEFDRKTWRYVAFKGGSEPGVLSFTWLLERADGHSFVLSIVLNDSTRGIDTAAAVTVAQGAVDLLAKAH
jgi:beta-lactamase class A